MIAVNNHRTFDHEASENFAVSLKFITRIIDDFHIDTEKHTPLSALISDGFFAVYGPSARQGSEGTHFGHAPSLNNVHVIFRLEGFDHGFWNG